MVDPLANRVREGRHRMTDALRAARPALLLALVALVSVVAGCFAVKAASRDGTTTGAGPAGLAANPGTAGAAAGEQGAAAGPPPPTKPTVRPDPGGGTAGKAGADGGGLLYGAQLQALPPLADIRQDEGASVLLPDGRTMYLFADTLHLHTPPNFFATSSAAITDPRTPLRLEFAADPRGVPLEFLPRAADEKEDQVNGVRYTAVWPTGATNLPDGRTIISYAKYDLIINPFTMTFRGAGLYEYRYSDAPHLRNGGIARRIADDIWTPETGPVGTPVYHDAYVYFTLCEDLECYSMRVKPNVVADPSSYRWWTGGGWSASKSDRSPMAFGASRPGHNPSVVWVPSVDAFVMADTVAGDVARSGLLWVAPNPWGPWSVPATVGLTRCSSGGCYGLNVQAGGSTSRTIRISYSPVMVNRIGPFVYLIDQVVRVSNGGRRVSTPG
jgi:hypothetical protein